MSYTFTVKRPTKSEAKHAVRAEFDKIVSNQPPHARDCNGVIAAADAFIDALDDRDGHDFEVSIYGSVSWWGTWGTEAATVVQVSANITARTVAKT
jgi:hypothetical protein